MPRSNYKSQVSRSLVTPSPRPEAPGSKEAPKSADDSVKLGQDHKTKLNFRCGDLPVENHRPVGQRSSDLAKQRRRCEHPLTTGFSAESASPMDRIYVMPCQKPLCQRDPPHARTLGHVGALQNVRTLCHSGLAVFSDALVNMATAVLPSQLCLNCCQAAVHVASVSLCIGQVHLGSIQRSSDHHRQETQESHGVGMMLPEACNMHASRQYMQLPPTSRLACC